MTEITEIRVLPHPVLPFSSTDIKKYSVSFCYKGLKFADLLMIYKNGYYDFEYPTKAYDKNRTIAPVWYFTDLVFKDNVEQEIVKYWEAVLKKMDENKKRKVKEGV